MLMRARIYNHCNDLRSLLGIVSRRDFLDAYEALKGPALETVDKILLECQHPDYAKRQAGIAALRKWLREESGIQSISGLRDHAAQLGIVNYSRKSKIQLLREISEWERNQKEKAQSPNPV